MGTPEHLIIMIQNLYNNQTAVLRTEFGNTEKIRIEKGVRQGCILSPLLFNIYAERIMRSANISNMNGIRIGGREINNLRYADDTTLLARSEGKLKELLRRVKEHSEKAGLFLNVSKTKVMSTSNLQNFNLEDENIEVINNFNYLGAEITQLGICSQAIDKRLALARSAMMNMRTIWKDRNITLNTKIKLVKALVFPVALYGSETWVMKVRDRRRLDAFEMWCWRQLLGVTWKDRRTNIWVSENIKSGSTLEAEVVKNALKYFGHITRKDGCLEKEIMFAGATVSRRKGRPKKNWFDMIKGFTNMKISELCRMARNRDAWRRFVYEITRNRHRFDGTR